MLEAKELSKTYNKRPVLRGVSFTLRPGECLGIAGHNGSGKSTLMSVVAQVVPPDAGRICLDGKNVLGDRSFLRTNVGYVPQHNSLLGDLTVLETLRFWQRVYGLTRLDLFSPDSPCTLLGLEEIAKKRVGALSGGMQKRLSTALALMHSPRFLLMDEVLSSLDRHYRTLLNGWLARARGMGTAILYCSHEVDELKGLCDNILVLREGETVFYGPAAEFPADSQTLDRMMNPTGY